MEKELKKLNKTLDKIYKALNQIAINTCNETIEMSEVTKEYLDVCEVASDGLLEGIQEGKNKHQSTNI